MSALDLILLGLLGFSAWVGYRRGLLVGLMAFIGLVVGALIGVAVAVRVVHSWVSGTHQTFVALLVVVLMVSLTQGLLSMVGTRLKAKVRWKPGRVADAALGAALNLATVLVLVWGASTALGHTPVPGVTRAINQSVVLRTLSSVAPSNSDRLLASFRNLLDESEFPKVFQGLGEETITEVGQPNPALARNPAAQRAQTSVVEIAGDAASCRQHVTGSGFIFARQRVLTNAHVVAGVNSPMVRVGGQGAGYPATVVEFDPQRDLAVLAVPGLATPPLSMSGQQLQRGDDAIIAGFPNGGPYTVSAAKLREIRPITGPDIYEKTLVTRDVLALRAHVDHGSSGGPVLSARGQVIGIVFAKSKTDPETAYALPITEILPLATHGTTATAAVATGGCAG